MAKKKSGISFERHQEIGKSLKEIRNTIDKLRMEFYNAYPANSKKSRAYKHLSIAQRHLEDARSFAEENYATEYPNKWTTETYYGKDWNESD